MPDTEYPIPSVQRAWRSVRRGPPLRSLSMQSDVPVPKELQNGEVLIKVEAAALNPIGYKMMQLAPNFIAKRPHVAEFDLAGVIVDQKSSEFEVGDKVIAWIPTAQTFKTGQGALAQYTRVPADQVFKRPDHISAVEGAGFPLASMAAILALEDLGKMKHGQCVFINGGSTAVGAYAIQIAKAKGCKVIASCSKKNIELVKSFGADDVFDYTIAPLHQQLMHKPPSPKINIFFECVGLAEPHLYSYGANYLAPNSIFISVGPQPTSFGTFLSVLQTLFETRLRPVWLGGVNARWTTTHASHKQPYWDEIKQLIYEGKLKPYVDSTFEFEKVIWGYERLMSNRATGKVVIQVSS